MFVGIVDKKGLFLVKARWRSAINNKNTDLEIF